MSVAGARNYAGEPEPCAEALPLLPAVLERLRERLRWRCSRDFPRNL